MADHLHNEMLEQQRKAREEFLALKKMQSGEIETGPKPSEVAIVPKTPVEKLKNIWFHDKWVILGGLAIAIIMAVMITQCATRTKYDLEVVALAYTPLSDAQMQLAADYLEQYCEDINGDGEVNIQMINCSFNKDSTDQQYRYTMSSKLQAVIAADANALLFITDKEGYDYLNNLTEDGSIFEGEPVLLNEKFYEACASEEAITPLPEGLMISCRAVSGKTISKDKNIESYLEQSKNIINNLK